MSWIKQLTVALLLLLPGSVRAQAELYTDRNREGCSRAIGFWQMYRDSLEQENSRAGVSAAFLFAIVAPELSQYNRVSDLAQTYALKVLYVQSGKHYGDFSIGPFQMKPSFAELLERELRKSPELQALFPEIPVAAEDTREARAERIRRLQSAAWQRTYLSLFCRIAGLRFRDGLPAAEKDRLRLFANAYNIGLLHDAAYLLEDNRRCFPRGGTPKFRYADLSVWFYDTVTEPPARF